MSDKVLIPLPGIGTLSLSREAFEAALTEGAGVVGPAGAPGAADDEPLLTAERLSEALGDVPVTWIEAAGRDGRIPSVECGRWRRFRRAAVERALTKGAA